jgi:hypothetical protein
MIIKPEILFNRQDILSRPCPVPSEPGVYAWFFREVPDSVPLEGCVKYNGLWLLYIGISPKRPPRIGNPSRQTLRTRIRYHYRGNAEGSTLRLTLGCLLADHLGLELCRVGSGKRMTFTQSGENILSNWMADNAFVAWEVHEEPWLYEEELIRTLSLPLNLEGNRSHPFWSELSRLRASAKDHARNKPIVPN